MNELIFLFHSISIAFASLLAAYCGQEALTTFVALMCILANLFVIKQITLFGLEVTASDAFSIGAVAGLNLLNEYYSVKSAKMALYIAFGSATLIVFLSQIHLLYSPNSFDVSQGHFQAVLGTTPRIIAASLFSYFISQSVENRLYAFLKILFKGNYLVMRNYLSMSISQLIDTILFTFLGLYGLVGHVIDIIIVSYCIKLVSIAIISPLLWFSQWYLKEKQL